MGYRDRSEGQAGRLRHIRLDRSVVAVVVLDRGRGFDFDHAPAPLSRLVHGQQDVGECQGARAREPGLEDRLRGGEQGLAAPQRGGEPVRQRIDLAERQQLGFRKTIAAT
jgi:hypothetical protein